MPPVAIPKAHVFNRNLLKTVSVKRSVVVRYLAAWTTSLTMSIMVQAAGHAMKHSGSLRAHNTDGLDLTL